MKIEIKKPCITGIWGDSHYDLSNHIFYSVKGGEYDGRYQCRRCDLMVSEDFLNALMKYQEEKKNKIKKQKKMQGTTGQKLHYLTQRRWQLIVGGAFDIPALIVIYLAGWYLTFWILLALIIIGNWIALDKIKDLENDLDII